MTNRAVEECSWSMWQQWLSRVLLAIKIALWEYVVKQRAEFYE